MISEEELEEMYWGRDMSMSDIAKEIGVSHSTVHRWMKHHGVPCRSVSKSLLRGIDMVSKEELDRMYWGDGMSSINIAEIVGVSNVTVLNWMTKYGIERRSRIRSLICENSMPSKEELNYMYTVEEMTANDIAKVFGVWGGTVRGWMKKYGIESRTVSEAKTGKHTGENNPRWMGGISFKPYCKKFNNKFKEAVRERDNYICQLCGCEQLIDGQKLDVHHIHYDKENCYPDVVALCRSCNTKVNFDRDRWEDFFELQLVERGMLNWRIQI